MEIVIAGRGRVGDTLGVRWLAAGHRVSWARRSPAGDREVPLTGAAQGADVLVVATPAGSAAGALRAAAPLPGTLVIDCTNPLRPGLSGVDHDDGRSGAERLQDIAPDCPLYKAFNSVGVEVMRDPVFEDRRAMMPFCGGRDDDPRNDTVAALVADVGFDPVRVGGLPRAAQLEHLAFLWIRMSQDPRRGRRFAFALLRDDGPGATMPAPTPPPVSPPSTTDSDEASAP